MSIVGAILGMAGAGLARRGVGLGIDMGKQKWQQKQQVEQQQKLQEQQIAGQKEMGEFNKGLAIDTWKETASPQAQVSNLKDAGLNVGLAMGGGAGGGGGATAQTGNVSGGTAGLGVDLSEMARLEMESQKTDAAVKNLNEDTKGKEIDNRNKDTGGIDYRETDAKIANLVARTKNEEVQKDILEAQKKMAQITAHVADVTQADVISKIAAEADLGEQNVRQSMVKTGVDEATQQELIDQLRIKTQMGLAELIAKQEGIKWDYGNTAVVERYMKMAGDLLGSIGKVKVITDKKPERKTK